MSTSEVKRVRELENENRRLKTLLADSMLEITMIKDLLSKKEILSKVVDERQS